LKVTDAARDLLAEEGFEPAYGARPMKRVMQQRLQNPLSQEILSGRFEEGTTVVVDGQVDGFVFSTEDSRSDTEDAAE